MENPDIEDLLEEFNNKPNRKVNVTLGSILEVLGKDSYNLKDIGISSTAAWKLVKMTNLR